MNVWSDIKYKAKFRCDRSHLTAICTTLLSDGTSAVVFYRLNDFFSRVYLGIVGYIFVELNKILNACYIGRGARFGKGFVILHPFGIVIHGAVKGGENIVIESGVVIGARWAGFRAEAPLLGNNIFIGAGAKILGGIKIGDNVKIGANAVVLTDVPDNATVVVVPARVVKRDENK